MTSSSGQPAADRRKPVFDAFRAILGRSFTQDEVARIDAALDQAGVDRAGVARIGDAPQPGGHRLGALSEEFESGGRGPETVSGGGADFDGVHGHRFARLSFAGTEARVSEGAERLVAWLRRRG